MSRHNPKAAQRARRIVASLALAGLVGSAYLGSAPARAADPTQPGLASAYTFGDFHDISEVVERATSGKPNAGAPVLVLDHRGNEGKKVLTSNQHKFTGAILSGFIKFPQAGTYQFTMRTNDGTMVVIDGQTILKDGEPHPDRDKGPASFSVSEPGWRPIKVYFYQRLGSWALKLSWSGPGLSGVAPVGGEYLAH